MNLAVADLNHDVLCSKHGVPDVLYLCSKQLESLPSNSPGNNDLSPFFQYRYIRSISVLSVNNNNERRLGVVPDFPQA